MGDDGDDGGTWGEHEFLDQFQIRLDECFRYSFIWFVSQMFPFGSGLFSSGSVFPVRFVAAVHC